MCKEESGEFMNENLRKSSHFFTAEVLVKKNRWKKKVYPAYLNNIFSFF